MRHILFMLLFTLPINLLVDSAHAQCPEETPRGIRIVEEILTSTFGEEGDISASVDSIRALNEEQDLEACRHFSNLLDPGDDEFRYRQFRYYKAGDYYFVLNLVRPRAEWPDPEELFAAPRETGHVFDQDLESVLVFFL